MEQDHVTASKPNSFASEPGFSPCTSCPCRVKSGSELAKLKFLSLESDDRSEMPLCLQVLDTHPDCIRSEQRGLQS